MQHGRLSTSTGATGPSEEVASGFRLEATASPLAVPNIPTIGTTAHVTLLARPTARSVIEIDAPRDTAERGQAFVVRFLTLEGPRRALFQCLSATPRPPMRSRVLAMMLADAVDARGRGAPRSAVEQSLAATVTRSAKLRPNTRVTVQVVDVSKGGAGLETGAQLEVGDVLTVHAAVGDGHEGVALEIVRRDPRHRGRFGSRYLCERDGEAFAELLVSVRRAEEQQVRRAHEEMARRAGILAAKARHRLADAPAGPRSSSGNRIHIRSRGR